jgi:hypothetical protein
MRQKDSVHTILKYCFKTHLVLPSHLFLGLTSGPFPSIFFPPKFYMYFSFTPYVQYHLPVSFILINFIALILFVVERPYKLPSSSLRSFLLHPEIQTTSLGFLFLKHLRPCLLLKTKLKFLAHAKQRAMLWLYILNLYITNSQRKNKSIWNQMYWWM